MLKVKPTKKYAVAFSLGMAFLHYILTKKKSETEKPS